ISDAVNDPTWQGKLTKGGAAAGIIGTDSNVLSQASRIAGPLSKTLGTAAKFTKGVPFGGLVAAPFAINDAVQSVQRNDPKTVQAGYAGAAGLTVASGLAPIIAGTAATGVGLPVAAGLAVGALTLPQMAQDMETSRGVITSDNAN